MKDCLYGLFRRLHILSHTNNEILHRITFQQPTLPSLVPPVLLFVFVLNIDYVYIICLCIYCMYVSMFPYLFKNLDQKCVCVCGGGVCICFWSINKDIEI